MNHDKLKHLRSKVMFTIVGGMVIINPAYAQNSPDPQPAAQTAPSAQTTSQKPKNGAKPSATTLQVITVTGVRNSLEQSMNIKRYAIGGVDAVSAEDIGKFPDTNLAESLQRITGVSIDRRNGEGSQVTVRGFGPNFNLITIDGRTVPGADAFGGPGQTPIGNVDGGTRSFNFAQLSPNGVNTLEVYKTGRADVASGGIGATIDIKTDRPFNHKGGEIVGSFGAKATLDKSEPFDTSITPEYSGNFSYANPDKTWGIGLDASFAKRHGGSVQSTENNWNVQPWTGANQQGFNANTNIVNAPALGQLYAIPNDVRYAYYDFKSERKNAHAVFQLHPTDSLTMTLDYLYSRYTIDANRGEQSMWLQQQDFSDVTFDTGNAVKTPLYIRDVVQTKDFGLEQQRFAQQYKLDDIGFNTEWAVNDGFKLTLDLHDAKSQSLPNDPLTGGGATFVGLAGTNNCSTGPQCGGSWGQEFFFNNGLPTASRTWYPTTDSTGPGQTNVPFTANNLGIQPMRIDAQSQTTEVKEAKLGGDWEFDNGRFQFGTDFIKTKLHRTQAAENYQSLGDWGVNNAGAFPDLTSVLKQVNTVGQFSGYNTSGITQSTWIGNADDLAKFAASKYPGSNYQVSPNLAADNTVIENTKAIYAQVVLEGQLASLSTVTRFGMRYEQTDISSSSIIGLPDPILWLSNNDFQVNTGSVKQPVSVRNSYSNLLPNVDFTIDITDSLQGRASYSRTIARAPYGNLYAGANAGAPNGSILINPSSQASANDNDPGLKPLSSDNLDLGLGWYFAPSSYVSVTFWDKRVDNFIGTTVTDGSVYGLRDPTSGPRAQQAAAFLASPQCAAQAGAPCALNDTTLFAATALLSNPATGGLAAYNGTNAQSLALERDYDITANADDPLYTFAITKPANVHKAMLHGWEFGGQYFLGDTGFGVLANYTKVLGDVSFNNAGDPNVDQFALTGLSDSANAVLMYEKYDFSVRLAYNWRAEFLTAANQGNSRNPYYVDAYHQTDLSINYNWDKHLSFQFEAINLTGEDVRWHARTAKQFVRVEDQKPRYAVGVRYTF
ncbi:MAG: TonB-dependent receptor [Rhodanobacter sp.]